jgi:hypothetical protein
MLTETKKRAVKEKLLSLLIKDFHLSLKNRFEKVKTKFFLENLTFKERTEITKFYIKLSRKAKRKLYIKL